LDNDGENNEFKKSVCDKIENFLENVGIKFEKENKSSKNGKDVIHKEIENYFKELENKWKKENPTRKDKVKKWIKKGCSKIFCGKREKKAENED